jgi:hypothetical protein
MKRYIVLTAFLLSTFSGALAWAQLGCESWTEFRDGRVLLCTKCGSTVTCN